jgi:hypothetical protein
MNKKIITLIFFLIPFIFIFQYYFSNDSKSSYISKTNLCKKNNNYSKYDINCLESVFLNNNNSKSAADAYIDIAKSDKFLGEYCHQFLHSLGSAMNDNEYDDITDTKSEEIRYSSCGYGFLHGYFENIRLTGNIKKDVTLVSSICTPLNIYKDKRIISECFHAIGHAINSSYNSGLEGKNICMKSFNNNSEALIGCYGGLAMKIRDEYLKRINNGEKFPANIDWFEEVGRNCTEGDDLWTISCAPGFIQLATDQGIEYVKPFLEWCSAVLSDNYQCYQQTGVYLGHFSDRLGPVNKLLDVCRYGNNEKDSNICILSIPEGKMNSGYSSYDAVNFVCKSREEFLYCNDIYEKYLN